MEGTDEKTKDREELTNSKPTRKYTNSIAGIIPQSLYNNLQCTQPQHNKEAYAV